MHILEEFKDYQCQLAFLFIYKKIVIILFYLLNLFIPLSMKIKENEKIRKTIETVKARN